MFLSFFFFLCYGDHRDLHSFPTRRSSDLIVDSNGCSIEQLVPCGGPASGGSWKNHGQYVSRSEEHTSELQSRRDLVCRLLLEKKKKKNSYILSLYLFIYLSLILSYSLYYC